MHVASGDLWAGAEVQIFQLICALARNHDCQLTAVLLNEGELASRLRKAGIEVYVIDEARIGVLKITQSLVGLARKLRPQVIHTHRKKENLLGAIAAAMTPRAVSVRTTHGSPEHFPQGLALARRTLSTLDYMIGKYAQKRIVAVSAELQARLAQLYGSNHVECIWNGINVENVRMLADDPTAPALPGGLKIGFIGRLVAVKRVDVFLEIARALLHKRIDNVQFFIVGDGPLRDDLEKKTVKLGLENICRFLGFQANPLPLLKQMDALVLTSDHEGLPMTALEALTLGVPVIAHAVGGLPEVITSPAQGRLIASQDPRLFADAILDMVSTGKHRQQSSLLGAHYQIDYAADCYKELYKQLTVY